ncbi:hypothetical protein Tco_0874786 [Tanacetum coccineum]|uniref:Uncharacterized protein n=1 Tax=Tanacetum coccineum TaxID=301880 RepID=A0ABQ5BMK9_9ASTR
MVCGHFRESVATANAFPYILTCAFFRSRERKMEPKLNIKRSNQKLYDKKDNPEAVSIPELQSQDEEQLVGMEICWNTLFVWHAHVYLFMSGVPEISSTVIEDNTLSTYFNHVEA